MKFLTEVWRDIKKGENLDLYLTILVALTLVLLNTIGITIQSLFLPLILTVLALLAIGTLGNRHRIEMIFKKMSEDTNKLFHQKLPEKLENEISKNILRSSNLIMIGVSLENSIYRYYQDFESKLKKGDSIKIILVNPDNPACSMAATRQIRPINEDTQRIRILHAIDALKKLKESTSGDLEIRVIDDPLSYGGIVIDPETSHGLIFIWYYRYKTSQDNRPKIVLYPTNDYWYSLYKEEILAIWDNSKSIKSN